MNQQFEFLLLLKIKRAQIPVSWWLLDFNAALNVAFASVMEIRRTINPNFLFGR